MGPCTYPSQRPDTATGYVRIRVAGVRHQATHLAWERATGRAVPAGMTLDHRCHDPNVCRLARACPHRACDNAEHLELVSRAENTRRGHARVFVDRCLRGHVGQFRVYGRLRGGRRVQRRCAACHRDEARRRKAVA